MKTYSVYIHTCIDNGKSYIGITSMTPQTRWRYGCGYSAQPKFHNAIKKHGWHNFTHEIVREGLSKEAACEMERELIKLMDTINNGYNVSPGGEAMVCSPKLAADRYDPDTGKLICTYPSLYEAANDVDCSDSHISEACKGKLGVVAGSLWAYHGDAVTPPKRISHCRKRIAQIDPETGNVIAVYENLGSASKAAEISKSMISCCCNGKYPTGKGYVWRWCE